MNGDVAGLPDGTRLLHIGPHKTGTTTLQSAFHQSREQLELQGVHYAGRRAHSMTAALAVSGRPTPSHTEATGHWQELIDDVRASDARQVVISSEVYADAPEDRIPVIVDELDRSRVHVVVTLRPLGKILPSQWQQYMQNRMVISYHDWLREQLLNTEHTTVTPTFWRRHRHDVLIRRWLEVVGPDRLTVVAVDERDKSMLTASFEQLLTVRPGTLRSERTANRSLTFAEVELLRAFNVAWRERDWSEADYTRLVRFGAARHLQSRRPGADEERLLTPHWAVDRALEVQREMGTEIASMGVRVVGDLAGLANPDLLTDVGENKPVHDVPLDVAARLASGLVKATAGIPRRPAEPGRRVGELEAAARLRPPGVPKKAEGASPDGQRGRGGRPGTPLTHALSRLRRRLVSRLRAQ